MKRVFGLLLSAALLAVGCGPVAQAPRENTEVEVGYGTTKKENLTYSVASIGVKENEMKGYRDIYEYLEGRVAGVEVTPDKRILIRGLGTFNGSSDPLFIVDGHEVQDISTINPNDIKSIDILKDSHLHHQPERHQIHRHPERQFHRHLRHARRQRRHPDHAEALSGLIRRIRKSQP